jgi:large subunit ribosomal protein L29
MKATILRAQSVEELDKQMHELLKQQFTLRMQKGSGQLNRPSQFKAVRRDIARIKTLMAEKKAGSQA